MLFLSILFTKLLLTYADYDFEEAYCDISENICMGVPFSIDQPRMLFYDVNPPEGFNLRRDVYMRFAIMLAEANKEQKERNWHIVLPPWFNLYHWQSRVTKHEPIPWSHFFQVDALNSFAPVMEYTDTLSTFLENAVVIDVLYILQNYKTSFDDGDFDDKWETTDDCYYDGEFWGYNNVTVRDTVCVNFQGKISMLWELIALHPGAETVMFAHAEIPLHKSYGSKIFWDCRKSMKFSQRLLDIANEFIEEELSCNDTKCSSYLAVHWRRQDFARSRGKGVPTPEGTAAQINKVILRKELDVKYVFVATDAKEDEVRKLRSKLSKLSHEVKIFTPKDEYVGKLNDGDIAIIDQIICSRGAYFLGTHESTFTYRIQEEREILGFRPETTFNRLCPDKGHCDKPSKWTMVN